MSQVAIRIGTETGRVFVKSPYNKAFVEAARKLNGKWVGSTSEWAFDGRDEQRVRDLCMNFYGTDGRAATSLVTLRAAMGRWNGSEFTLGGRVVARRSGRDYGVRLGDGVILLEGGFPKSGGSMKNPRIDADDGTVLEVRDFPESLAGEVLAQFGPDNPWGIVVEIVGQPYAATGAKEAPAVDTTDPLTQAIEAGLARINAEGSATVDAKAVALAKIRELMNEHGITADDLR